MIDYLLSQLTPADIVLFFLGLIAIAAAIGYCVGYRIGFTTAVDICNGLSSGRRATDAPDPGAWHMPGMPRER